MKLPFNVSPALPALVQSALLDMKTRLEATFSWSMAIYDTTANLPPASQWQGREVIVRDLGGSPGRAIALDGAWYDENWSAI